MSAQRQRDGTDRACVHNGLRHLLTAALFEARKPTSARWNLPTVHFLVPAMHAATLHLTPHMGWVKKKQFLQEGPARLQLAKHRPQTSPSVIADITEPNNAKRWLCSCARGLSLSVRCVIGARGSADVPPARAETRMSD